MRSLYPRLRISGSATVPMVSAVAVEEPEMAENSAQAMMFDCASPPGHAVQQHGDALVEAARRAAAQDDLAHQHEQRHRRKGERIDRIPDDVAEAGPKQRAGEQLMPTIPTRPIAADRNADGSPASRTQ